MEKCQPLFKLTLFNNGFILIYGKTISNRSTNTFPISFTKYCIGVFGIMDGSPNDNRFVVPTIVSLTLTSIVLAAEYASIPSTGNTTYYLCAGI